MATPIRETTPFRLYELQGTYREIAAGAQNILRRITAHWRRRQALAAGVAAVTIGAGLFLLFEAVYLYGFLLVLVGLAAGFGALSSGRHLEIEVETIHLCISLIDELEDSVDLEATCRLEVDMRSASHMSKSSLNQQTLRIVDHWFTADLALESGRALRLMLSEHVSQEVTRTGRRLGRDYEVVLFADASFSDDSLREAIISHVSTPSATTLKGRVREGLDVFNAAIGQLRVAYRTRTSTLVSALEGALMPDESEDGGQDDSARDESPARPS